MILVRQMETLRDSYKERGTAGDSYLLEVRIQPKDKKDGARWLTVPVC